MRGRKPKPKALKVLEGTRKDRINDQEPIAPAGRPDPPFYLDQVGLDEWHRIVPELEAIGVLSKVDGAALGLYCASFASMIEADAEVVDKGMLTLSAGGSYKANPAVSIARMARIVCARLLIEFGLTPSSRTRLKVGGGESSAKDEIEAFIARNHA